MIGGEAIRRCTSATPAARSSLTSFRMVVPRTMESSTSTTRLPSMMPLTGLNLIRTDVSRSFCAGEMKVRPT